MANDISRRGLVAAAPAAMFGASLPPFARDASKDAELFALFEPWERTFGALAIYGSLHTKAEDALHEALRAKPKRSREELEKEVGFDVAEEQWEAAVDANTHVLNLIAAAPARTLDGLRFKAHVCAMSDFESDLALAIVDDLVAMGCAHA